MIQCLCRFYLNFWYGLQKNKCSIISSNPHQNSVPIILWQICNLKGSSYYKIRNSMCVIKNYHHKNLHKCIQFFFHIVTSKMFTQYRQMFTSLKTNHPVLSLRSSKCNCKLRVLVLKIFNSHDSDCKPHSDKD